ncbi:MAG: hypothetical protein Q7T54_01875 [Candidatus Levybacteria bacterium]|nr:hypothetical protein [Candidatus Levybacteria bacterium]
METFNSYYFLVPLMAVSIVGLIYSSIGCPHPVRIFGPILNQLGVDLPWAMTQEEIRRDVSRKMLRMSFRSG